MCLCPGFGGCHPGATHCLPAWCSVGLPFLGPMRLTNEETILTGYHPRGTAQPANLGKKKQTFSVKKAIACPGALASRAGFCLGTRLGAHLGSLQGPKPGDAIFVLSLCPTPSVQYLLERNLYACLVS